MGIPEGKERKGTGEISEVTTTQIFLKLLTDGTLQIQEAQRTLNTIIKVYTQVSHIHTMKIKDED